MLFASNIFSVLGLNLGLNVMGSETHGMSQRGGSVIAHLKLGNFQSPLIQTGSADVLYSFEEKETYRTLKFLKGGGVCFANLQDMNRFDPKVLKHLKNKEITFKAYNASGVASKLGSILSTNIALIGYSVGTGLVPFRYKDMISVLERVSAKRRLSRNLKAFDFGVREGKSSRNSL